nr:MAG TPA: hypothetical protein [Caudoviricetes sp.]
MPQNYNFPSLSSQNVIGYNKVFVFQRGRGI